MCGINNKTIERQHGKYLFSLNYCKRLSKYQNMTIPKD